MALRQRQDSNRIGGRTASAGEGGHEAWLAELDRLAANPAALPDAARRALVETLDAFEAEDGTLPETAVRARAAFTRPRETPRG